MVDQFLSTNDRIKLAQTLERVYEMQLGPAARFGLLDKAGLRRFAPGTDLAAAPSVLAGVLISKLEPYGMLPNQPGYHALGALVNYALIQPDTPQNDARFLAEILVKYELIADPGYLGELRAQYSLDVSPARQADPALLPPTEPPALADEPNFDPVVGDQEALEQIVNSADNFLDIDMLAGAIYSAQAVGRIELPKGRAHGTGFLVGPDLILTNYHVFKSKDILASAVIRFDYQANADGVVTPGRVFEFVPDFYIGSPDKELDFALVKVKGEPLAERKMEAGRRGAGLPGVAAARPPPRLPARLAQPDRGARARQHHSASQRRPAEGCADAELRPQHHERRPGALSGRHAAGVVRLAGAQQSLGGGGPAS